MTAATHRISSGSTRALGLCAALVLAAASFPSAARAEDENATAKFLGSKADWAKCEIHLKDIHGLWGGADVDLSGDGKCAVHRKLRGEDTRFEFKLTAEEVAALFALVVQDDFTALKLAERKGVPDEARAEISLKNAAGKTFELAKWSNDKEPRFDRLHQKLWELGQHKFINLTRKQIEEKALEIAWQRWMEKYKGQWKSKDKPGCLRKAPSIAADPENKELWIVKFEDIGPRPAGDNWVRLKLDAQGQEASPTECDWSNE
jgi:hypothetical protein